MFSAVSLLLKNVQLFYKKNSHTKTVCNYYTKNIIRFQRVNPCKM